MRTALTVATLVALVTAAAVAPSSSLAQGTNVAVIDITEVFKNHSRFNQQMESLRTLARNKEEEFKQQQNELGRQNQKLQQFTPGTPEYRREEQAFAKQQSDLQVEIALMRKELVEREARIYYDTYHEVLDVIERIASRFNIGIVLRYDSRDMEPQDEASVMRGVNRAIVYQKDIDITGSVITEVNRGTPPANVGAQPQIPNRPVR